VLDTAVKLALKYATAISHSDIPSHTWRFDMSNTVKPESVSSERELSEDELEAVRGGRKSGQDASGEAVVEPSHQGHANARIAVR